MARDNHVSLESFAKKLGKARSLRRGSIAFRFSGAGAEDFFIDCSTGEPRVTSGAPPDRPLIELIGDPAAILAVLAGTKNPRAQFLAGGFRLRGDPHYINELAVELGILPEGI